MRAGQVRPATDEWHEATLCAWHHLRGVHAGVVRCAGAAPDALRFERGLLPPLLTFAPGERLVSGEKRKRRWG
jgi:hypothetical protein